MTLSILRIGLAGAFALASSAVAALDLIEAAQRAQAHDAKFAAARAAYDAGKEKLPQGRAQLLPTLMLTGSRNQYDASLEYEGTTTFEGGNRRYNVKEYELSLTQPLYRPQNLAAYRQGQAQADLAEAQLITAKQELLLRVAQAYFDLLAARDGLALARSQRQAYLGQHEQARAKLSAGVAAITEVHEAKARADLATAQIIAAENELERRQRALWKITGIDAEVIADLAADVPLIGPDPADLNRWVEQARARNPDLQALRENLRVAEHELNRAQGAHHPTVDLVTAHSNNESSGSVYTSATSDNRVQSVGVKLQIPLYQGGHSASRVREAAAGRDKTREELEDAQREIVVQTQQAYRAVTSGMAQIEALSQAVLSSDNALEASRAGFKAGARNLVDVLNATQQTYNAKRDHARARYDYLFAHLKLRAIAGTLTEEDMAWVNRFLDKPSPVSTQNR